MAYTCHQPCGAWAHCLNISVSEIAHACHQSCGVWAHCLQTATQRAYWFHGASRNQRKSMILIKNVRGYPYDFDRFQKCSKHKGFLNTFECPDWWSIRILKNIGKSGAHLTLPELTLTCHVSCGWRQRPRSRFSLWVFWLSVQYIVCVQLFEDESLVLWRFQSFASWLYKLSAPIFVSCVLLLKECFVSVQLVYRFDNLFPPKRLFACSFTLPWFSSLRICSSVFQHQSVQLSKNFFHEILFRVVLYIHQQCTHSVLI